MKTVVIAFRKKDIKLNALKWMDTIAIKVLSPDIWINEIWAAKPVYNPLDTPVCFISLVS